MRKLIFVFTLCLFAQSIFAFDWGILGALGLGVPIVKYDMEKGNDVAVTAFDFDCEVLGIDDDYGFTIGGLLDMGVGLSNDISDKFNVAFDVRLDFQVGWTPLRIGYGDFYLGVLAAAGISYTNFILNSKSKTETRTGYGYSYDVDYTHESTASTFNFYVGGDIFAIKMFNDHIGILARFGIRKILGTPALEYSESDYATEYDGTKWDYGSTSNGKRKIDGGLIFIPAVGFVIKIY